MGRDQTTKEEIVFSKEKEKEEETLYKFRRIRLGWLPCTGRIGIVLFTFFCFFCVFSQTNLFTGTLL